MKWVKKNNYKTNLIMKGNCMTFLQILSIDGDVLLGFREVLQYTVPCPLSKFLKQWKVPEAKGIFPHG